jgi:hypothetical protein
MKPADAKAPKFDSKWWKANKAKAADADSGFEKALKKYEDEKKAFFERVKELKVGTSTDALQKALSDLKAQATKKKGDPKLGALQKETKEGLGNYEKLADKTIGECKRAAGSPLMGMSIVALVKSGAPQFENFCKQRHVSENYNFLSLMAKNPKKERRWYDDFIKEGSKFQVNLPGGIRVPFDKIAADIKDGKSPDTPATWAAAPWDKAIAEVAQMMTRDVLQGFRAYAIGAMVKAKLP